MCVVMFESAEVGKTLDKATFVAKAETVRSALLDAQARLKESDVAVIIVIAGTEGAGKGETVNFLLNWLDVRQVETHAMGLPTEEETERPFHYRFWRRLPPKGKIAIFFGSWYTQPIVDRIERTIKAAPFDREMHRIVEFERMIDGSETGHRVPVVDQIRALLGRARGVVCHGASLVRGVGESDGTTG